MKKGIVFEGITKDGETFTIRYPARGDLKELHRFINTLSREKTFINFQGSEISLEYEKEWLEKILQRIKKKEGACLVVCDGAIIIGVGEIFLRSSDIQRHVGDLDMSIAKEYRGKGVGTKLMDCVLKESVKNTKGMKIVTLKVFKNNSVAIKMYKRFGFKKYGSLPGGVFHRGKYVDDIDMYKKV